MTEKEKDEKELPVNEDVTEEGDFAEEEDDEELEEEAKEQE